MKTAVGIAGMALGYMLIYAAVKFGKGGRYVKNPWLVWQVGKTDVPIPTAAETDPGYVSVSDLFLTGSNGGGGMDA